MDHTRVYAVLWGLRGPTNDADEVASAVQRVLASAHGGHEWPDKMPDGAWRKVIPGDGKCLYWALSAVEGNCGQAAAEEVRRALTQGDMAQPQSLRGRGRSCETQECRHVSNKPPPLKAPRW